MKISRQKRINLTERIRMTELDRWKKSCSCFVVAEGPSNTTTTTPPPPFPLKKKKKKREREIEKFSTTDLCRQFYVFQH